MLGRVKNEALVVEKLMEDEAFMSMVSSLNVCLPLSSSLNRQQLSTRFKQLMRQADNFRDDSKD